MQFSLRQLIYATAIIGIACVALMYATPFWAALAFSVTILLLLAAFVLASAAKGQQRMFWVGFAVCGWGYLAVLHSPLLGGNNDNWHAQSGGPLVTSLLLDSVYFKVLPLVHAEPQIDATGMAIRSSSNYPFSPDFYRVGHSLFALLSALCGGLLGSSAFVRYQTTAASRPQT